MASANKILLAIPVAFGGVSIGRLTCRIGVVVTRCDMSLETADSMFCGHRVTGRVTLSRNDERQGVLVDDLDHCINGAADVKRVSATPDSISFGLTYSLADMDIAEIARFAKGKGRIEISAVEDIPDESDNH